MSKSFHELLASDPSLSPAFRAAFADDGPDVERSSAGQLISDKVADEEDPIVCDWCGCTTHEPVFRNGLQFAPGCLPAYEADQAEQEAIDLEDTERRLSRAFDAVAYPEDPGRHFRNIQIARMKRKQAARETGAEQGISQEEVA